MCLKNIIIVYDYAFINGGAAKIAIQSAIALSKQNYNVYYYSAVGPVCKELLFSNVQIHCLNTKDINTANRLIAIKNGIWNSSVKKNFHKFLSPFSPEDTVVHIHGWVKALSSSVVKTSTNMNFKTFITLHDYFTLCPNGGFYNFKRNKICKLKGFGIKCLFCNCDKRNYIQKLWRAARQFIQDFNVKRNPNITYISLSDLNECLVKSYVRSKQFVRVNNFVTPPPYRNENASASKTFICVGRLSIEKGVDIFCEAMHEIITTYPNIKALVVGEGELSPLRNKYPEIDFVGWKTQEEIYKLLKDARALVLPSRWYEGFPLTVMEALTINVPCLISNCTSATEIITNMKTGLIFKSNNVDSLIQEAKVALDDNFLHNCQQNIEKMKISHLFSIQNHIDSLIAAYEGEAI